MADETGEKVPDVSEGGESPEAPGKSPEASGRKHQESAFTAAKVPAIAAAGDASPLVYNIVKRAYNPEKPKEEMLAGLRLDEYQHRVIQIDGANKTVRMMRKNTGVVNVVRNKALHSFELRRSCEFSELQLAEPTPGNASLLQVTMKDEQLEFYAGGSGNTQALRRLLKSCIEGSPLPSSEILKSGTLEKCGRALNNLSKIASFFSSERKELLKEGRYVELRGPMGEGTSARLLVFKAETSGCAHNIFELNRCSVSLDSSSIFSLLCDQGVLVSFVCKDSEDRDEWIKAVEVFTAPC